MLADMYSVLDVARYVIARSNRAGAISNLKLQKVLYFIQAEFLVVQNTPCFAEQIEAWDFWSRRSCSVLPLQDIRRGCHSSAT